MILHLFFLVILILCNAFFSAAEVALISLKPVTLEQLSKNGRRGRILGTLSADTGRFLATVQVGVTFAGFLASAFAADTFSDPIARRIYDAGFTGMSMNMIDTFSVVAITLVLSYFSLVFGELVPKQIALRYTSFVALNSAIPIHFLSWLASPLVWLLNNSVGLVMRSFESKEDTEKLTEEEIRSIINMGEKDGLIDPGEFFLIQNVFDLDKITCGEVMTRRGAVCAINIEATPAEVEHILLEKRFSAYPVYEEGTIDKIAGILYASDYFRNRIRTGRPPDLRSTMQAPHLVPEGTNVLQVLRDMQKKQFEIAVLLDEFGGTAGVVTRDDLLEELVGSLHPPKPEELLKHVSEYTWMSGGLVRIAEVERELNCKLPEDGCSDTVGGLVLAELDDIPKPGDVAEIGGMRFTVQAIDGRRITRVRIERQMEEKPDEAGWTLPDTD